MPDIQDTQLQIGRIIKPHGVRGELVVEATTDQPEERFAVGEVLTGKQAGKTRELTVAKVRPHQGRLLVTFEEIPDRTQAETLRGLRFFADPIEDPDDDSFYDHQLEGLRVLKDEQDIGEVTGVLHGPAGTTLEVTINEDSALPTAGRTVLIPFRHAIVPVVDLDNDALEITPPDGLLELM